MLLNYVHHVNVNVCVANESNLGTCPDTTACERARLGSSADEPSSKQAGRLVVRASGRLTSGSDVVADGTRGRADLGRGLVDLAQLVLERGEGRSGEAGPGGGRLDCVAKR